MYFRILLLKLSGSRPTKIFPAIFFYFSTPDSTSRWIRTPFSLQPSFWFKIHSSHELQGLSYLSRECVSGPKRKICSPHSRVSVRICSRLKGPALPMILYFFFFLVFGIGCSTPATKSVPHISRIDQVCSILIRPLIYCALKWFDFRMSYPPTTQNSHLISSTLLTF